MLGSRIRHLLVLRDQSDRRLCRPAAGLLADLLKPGDAATRRARGTSKAGTIVRVEAHDRPHADAVGVGRAPGAEPARRETTDPAAAFVSGFSLCDAETVGTGSLRPKAVTRVAYNPLMA
jgi:hypothetical protein